MPESAEITGKNAGVAAEERRAALRREVFPEPEGKLPQKVSALGKAALGLFALASLFFFVMLFVSIAKIFTAEGSLGGEMLFASGVGLGFSLFSAWIWLGFLRLADWRIEPAIPLSVKFYSAAGASLSATLAALSAATLLVSICAKSLFLTFMESIGGRGIPKVEIIFATMIATAFFTLTWHLYQGLMELRDRARVALATILGAAFIISLAGMILDYFFFAGWLGHRGILVFCAKMGAISLIALICHAAVIRKETLRHFNEDEF